MSRLTQEQLDRLRHVAEAATPRPWEWGTSCSWRRLGRVGGRDGGVLCPTNHHLDHHVDLNVTEQDMRLIEEGCNALQALIEECDHYRRLDADVLGRAVLDAIIGGAMIRCTECAADERGAVLAWNGNAPEQIGTALLKILRGSEP